MLTPERRAELRQTLHYSGQPNFALDRDIIAALLDAADERDRLRIWQERVALAAGIADEVEGRGVYLESDPDIAAEHMAGLLSVADTHAECPVHCDEHEHEQLEWPLSCPDCHGSGLCGPPVIDFIDGVVPNWLGHPGECGACGGDGRDHTGPGVLVTLGYAKDFRAAAEDARRADQ